MPHVRLDDFRGMVLVSDLFIASASALPSAFPGWLPPLPQPVRRQLRNPFSGEMMYRNTGEPWLIDTVEPEGPWPREVRCPNLDAFPRVSLRPIRIPDIATLARVLPTPISDEPVAALFAPPQYGWSLWAIPESVSRSLASITSVSTISRAWVDAIRSHEDFDQEDFDQDGYATIDDWSAIVESISEMAGRAVSLGKELLLYDGPRPHA